MDNLTPHIDPANGDLVLDDGDLAWAASAALGCVVFTLRTQLGTCLLDTEIGTDWKVARADTADAPKALQREIERALRWVVDAGLLVDLVVTVERKPPRGLAWKVAFRPVGEARTRAVAGSSAGGVATMAGTRPTVDPLGDAEALAGAQRLASFVGPAIRAADGTVGAALYLALGAAIAATRRYTEGSLRAVFGHLAEEPDILHWERSLGMVSGEGMTLAARQTAVRARWVAANAGPTLLELARTVQALVPNAVLLPIAGAEVYADDPDAVFRVAILLPFAMGDDEELRGRIDAALYGQAESHVAWGIGRQGDGYEPDEIPPFRCNRPRTSRCDRDLLRV